MGREAIEATVSILPQGTAAADGAVVDLTQAVSPSPAQRNAAPSAAEAVAASAPAEEQAGARVPPAPGVTYYNISSSRLHGMIRHVPPSVC